MSKHLVLSFAVLGCMTLAGTASADVSNEPRGTSGCVYNGSFKQTCDLYENDTVQGATEGPITVNLVTLPPFEGGGVLTEIPHYVVLLESRQGSQTDPMNWSDILEFPDNGSGEAILARLWSDIGVGIFPTGAPTPAQVITGLTPGYPTVYLLEVGPPTGYTPFGFPDVFNIYSDIPGPGEEVAVPEPGTVLLLGAGLAGLAGLRRRTV